MSFNLTQSVADLFAREIERVWTEARKPAPLIDCPICGETRVTESQTQPGRCWFCEEVGS